MRNFKPFEDDAQEIFNPLYTNHPVKNMNQEELELLSSWCNISINDIKAFVPQIQNEYLKKWLFETHGLFIELTIGVKYALSYSFFFQVVDVSSYEFVKKYNEHAELTSYMHQCNIDYPNELLALSHAIAYCLEMIRAKKNVFINAFSHEGLCSM